jgi:hypothetical protein
MRTTVTLKAVSVGTEMTVVQDGVPEVIPLEGCYLGWQQSLANLARLVECAPVVGQDHAAVLTGLRALRSLNWMGLR